jgi:XTP/dITP diphosphohydrolase
MKNRLIIATANAHKLGEFRAAFAPLGIEIEGLRAFPELPPIEENGDTFAANAIIKALATARHTHQMALADDSGLEVLALGGAPGIFSARYAGIHGNDTGNNLKLLAELAHTHDRRARFVCALALAFPDGTVETVEGSCEGLILREPSGAAGFGYDPLFAPDGYDASFADLGDAVKSLISHRARAIDHAMQRGAPLWVGASREDQTDQSDQPGPSDQLDMPDAAT